MGFQSPSDLKTLTLSTALTKCVLSALAQQVCENTSVWTFLGESVAHALWRDYLSSLVCARVFDLIAWSSLSSDFIFVLSFIYLFISNVILIRGRPPWPVTKTSPFTSSIHLQVGACYPPLSFLFWDFPDLLDLPVYLRLF